MQFFSYVVFLLEVNDPQLKLFCVCSRRESKANAHFRYGNGSSRSCIQHLIELRGLLVNQVIAVKAHAKSGGICSQDLGISPIQGISLPIRDMI